MRRSCFLFFTILLNSPAYLSGAQNSDSTLLSHVETELSFADLLSIFNLIDSLLQHAETGGSQLALRLTYNSNVMSTGRTLGIQNFGLAPGVSYEAVENYRKYGTRFGISVHDKNVFGIMNYAVSVPVTVNHKNWGFAFSYTYNIPKALPGEALLISESSYLSGSITYFIAFKRNKLAL